MQAYYLAAPFPCERAPTKPLPPQQCAHLPASLSVSLLAGYPVQGFVVEVLSSAAGALKVCGYRFGPLKFRVNELLRRVSGWFTAVRITQCGAKVCGGIKGPCGTELTS